MNGPIGRANKAADPGAMAADWVAATLAWLLIVVVVGLFANAVIKARHITCRQLLDLAATTCRLPPSELSATPAPRRGP
jgi:hypothetical protein